jgi:hypothetical protein
MSLNLKQVIEAAREHFRELLPEFAKMQDIRLEEIEREGKNWAVTLSAPSDASNDIVVLRSPFGYNRIAKIVVVDGSDGRFVALRQRAA